MASRGPAERLEDRLRDAGVGDKCGLVVRGEWVSCNSPPMRPRGSGGHCLFPLSSSGICLGSLSLRADVRRGRSQCQAGRSSITYPRGGRSEHGQLRPTDHHARAGQRQCSVPARRAPVCLCSHQPLVALGGRIGLMAPLWTPEDVLRNKHRSPALCSSGRSVGFSMRDLTDCPSSTPLAPVIRTWWQIEAVCWIRRQAADPTHDYEPNMRFGTDGGVTGAVIELLRGFEACTPAERDHLPRSSRIAPACHDLRRVRDTAIAASGRPAPPWRVWTPRSCAPMRSMACGRRGVGTTCSPHSDHGRRFPYLPNAYVDRRTCSGL